MSPISLVVDGCLVTRSVNSEMEAIDEAEEGESSGGEGGAPSSSALLWVESGDSSGGEGGAPSSSALSEAGSSRSAGRGGGAPSSSALSLLLLLLELRERFSVT